MPTSILYLLKLSVSLSVVYLFYHIFLRKLTFYNWNRFYFLIYTLSSFFIAFINVSPVIQQNHWEQKNWVQWLPPLQKSVVTSYVIANAPMKTAGMNWWQVLLLIIAIGMVLMLLRLLVQFFSFRKIFKKAELLSGGYPRLYSVQEPIHPFSFGNAVFINPGNHSQEELEKIISHEFVHVKQKHSIDILWSELLCIINWYNPFVWLLRKSIRQNLEFIADEKVLQAGVERKEYQYLLLKVIGNTQFSIATPFNFSSLKKRIAMMNTIKSAKRHLAKFLFVLPLIAILLLAFREVTRKQTENGKNKQQAQLKYATVVYDAETFKPVTGVSVKNIYSGASYTTDENGYVEIPVAVDKENKMHIGFDFMKEGYIHWWGRKFEINFNQGKPVSQIELIGMKQGKGEVCSTCLATMTDYDERLDLKKQAATFFENYKLQHEHSGRKGGVLSKDTTAVRSDIVKIIADSVVFRSDASHFDRKTNLPIAVPSPLEKKNLGKSIDAIFFRSDSATFNQKTNELLLQGNVSFRATNEQAELSGEKIDCLTIDKNVLLNERMIVFDGKEINLEKDGLSVANGPGFALQVKSLTKEEAAKQLGTQSKGRKALIIITVPLK